MHFCTWIFSALIQDTFFGCPTIDGFRIEQILFERLPGREGALWMQYGVRSNNNKKKHASPLTNLSPQICETRPLVTPPGPRNFQLLAGLKGLGA